MDTGKKNTLCNVSRGMEGGPSFEKKQEKKKPYTYTYTLVGMCLKKKISTVCLSRHKKLRPAQCGAIGKHLYAVPCNLVRDYYEAFAPLYEVVVWKGVLLLLPNFCLVFPEWKSVFLLHPSIILVLYLLRTQVCWEAIYSFLEGL